MKDEQLARTVFETLAEAPEPPSRVDLECAVTAGRRRVWARRGFATGASALVLCMMVGGAGYAMTHRPGRHDLRRDAPPAATASPSPAHPTAFDPLVESVTAGYLPARLTDRVVEISRTRYLIDARDPYSPGSGPLPEITVSVFPGRIEQGPDRPHHERFRSAPAVNGHRASWVLGGVPTLRWEYAPDSYAEVAVSMPGTDQSAIARRVAASVRFGQHTPVRLPFRLSSLPTGLRPARTSVEVGGPKHGWDVQVEFSDEPGSVDPKTRLAHSLMIHSYVSDYTVGDAKDGSPNTRIHAHPSQQSSTSTSAALAFDDVDGRYVGLDAAGKPVVAALGPAGLPGLFRRMIFAGKDPADWPTDPLG
jgi:hypothetical protein